MPKELRERDFTVPVKQYKDIDLCLRRNPVTGDIAVKKGEAAIQQALKNLMLTRKGEKLFQPGVGSNIQNLLFEPLDEFAADRLELELINNVAQFDSRIEVVDIDIIPMFDDDAYYANMTYRIIGEPIVEELNFVLKRPGI